MPRAAGQDPRRSPEADAAIAEFKAKYGCLPYEAPTKLRDWLDILDRHRSQMLTRARTSWSEAGKSGGGRPRNHYEASR